MYIHGASIACIERNLSLDAGDVYATLAISTNVYSRRIFRDSIYRCRVIASFVKFESITITNIDKHTERDYRA